MKKMLKIIENWAKNLIKMGKEVPKIDWKWRKNFEKWLKICLNYEKNEKCYFGNHQKSGKNLIKMGK